MSRDALIVGINKYHHIASLKAPAHDAESVAQCLGQNDNFRVRRLPVKVEDKQEALSLQQQLTAEDLEDALIRLFTPEGNNYPETALFYFSGHGLRRTRGVPEGYLATSDTNADTRNFGVSLKWLRELLNESPIRNQIVWIDCCYSGELFNNDDADAGNKDGKNRCFIVASREFEPAFESLENPKLSEMTQALLAGLDNSAEQEIYDRSLAEHVSQALRGTRQSPLCRNSGQPILLMPGQRVRPAQSEQKQQQRRDWSIPLQMPPLPEHFVERPKYQDEVKEQLLCEDKKTFGTLVVSAIYGLGGIGKSVLASKLAHDNDVQARFADGILWSTLGP